MKGDKNYQRHVERHVELGESPEFPMGSRREPRASWTWMRQLALRRDHYMCRVCGAKERVKTETHRVKAGISFELEKVHRTTLIVHHIIPKNKGGSDHLNNLITLCELCNKWTLRQPDKGGVPPIPPGKQEKLR